MRQLTVLSGKGGTGKTTIAASIAVLADRVVIADCDVDAPDLHLLLHPRIIETQEFRGLSLAVIDVEKCTECGSCREKCRFDAITEEFKVDPISCEGCGVCAAICPANAVTLVERISGHAYISKTKYGFMAHAMLKPGEANSGKLVTVVRQNAKTLAEKKREELIVIDGSPGIGCPVIASVTGIEAGLVITEPTLSGIHDLERALQLLAHFDVPPFVCVNMYDINQHNTEKIVDLCDKIDVEIVGKIPFDPVVTEAMVNGKPIVEYAPETTVSKEIAEILKRILSALR